MSTEHALSNIASELRRIRLALERLTPPPPKDETPKKERTGRVWVL